MKKTTMLKKNYEFRVVLTKGKIFKREIIEAFILKNNKKRNFLGIAISTKNGKAFQRNRAKRLIRESFCKLENQIIDGCSIVILMNKKYDINKITLNQIYEEIKSVFIEANIMLYNDTTK